MTPDGLKKIKKKLNLKKGTKLEFEGRGIVLNSGRKLLAFICEVEDKAILYFPFEAMIDLAGQLRALIPLNFMSDEHYYLIDRSQILTSGMLTPYYLGVLGDGAKQVLDAKEKELHETFIDQTIEESKKQTHKGSEKIH